MRVWSVALSSSLFLDVDKDDAEEEDEEDEELEEEEDDRVKAFDCVWIFDFFSFGNTLVNEILMLKRKG